MDVPALCSFSSSLTLFPIAVVGQVNEFFSQHREMPILTGSIIIKKTAREMHYDLDWIKLLLVEIGA